MAAALPPFRSTQLAALTLLAACALTPAFAADEIVTDRPDFVESSDVVGRGRFQIETGFSSERQDGNGLKTRTRSTPTLLRLGVSDALELRVETDGATRSRTQDTATDTTTTSHGFADTSLGLKWRMQEGNEESGAPGMAWLLHADLASGSRDFRGQGVRPSLRFVAEWDLPHDFSVGVMPGVVADKTGDGKRFAAGIFAVTLGKGWGPAWHSFVEVAGQQLAAQRNGGKVVSFDFGASYLVTDSLQLDLAGSRGLTRETADFQWGAGVSIRF
ncbi:MAG TPA: transporter [Ideonella sp.]|uniref:transporter n=1 Tax=Ideonella sp. TaxID=1929293 RepID=UPI002C7D938E|nr:transporter [Ideonella sp.]HSI48181.1 transporter [Ideonella sp.]